VSSGQQRTGDENVNEVELILNGAGYFVATENEKISMTICPRQRKKLTTDWAGRKSNTCSYPSHRGPRKTIKKPLYPYNFFGKREGGEIGVGLRGGLMW